MNTSLTQLPLMLENHRLGPVQRSGQMWMVPIFGDGAGDRYLAPLTGLKLSRVAGYGHVELECRSTRDGSGIAIVPLHIGYIQDGAQNHAMCRSAFMTPGQKLMFDDACCVQESQGGYLESRDQWFFILPVTLRDTALSLRGEVGYGKLWPAISELSVEFGKEDRGHLDQVICRERPYLGQYVNRFERLPGQLGALFFLGGKLAGIEIAPNAAYFAETWMPLVSFCYGPSAMLLERGAKRQEAEPFEADSLASLREAVIAERSRAEDAVGLALSAVPAQRFSFKEEERLLDLELVTATSECFSGQLVQGRDGKLVYASLAARPSWLAAA